MTVTPMSSTGARIPPPPRGPLSPPAEAPDPKNPDPARDEGAAPLRAAAEPTPTTMRIVALVDPVLDQLGYAATSLYVETYWLSVLGPSTTWLLRRLVAGLEEQPDGYCIDLQDKSHLFRIEPQGPLLVSDWDTDEFQSLNHVRLRRGS